MQKRKLIVEKVRYLVVRVCYRNKYQLGELAEWMIALLSDSLRKAEHLFHRRFKSYILRKSVKILGYQG